MPTIGRLERLSACLSSIAACEPPAAEVLVVDQSEAEAVEALVEGFGRAEFRHLPCERRGVAHGTNVGLRCAAHDLVAVTHDDCTVDPTWVAAAATALAERPGRIVTGRVLPAGGGRHVPSTIDLEGPREYVFGRDFSVLFPNNMALDRNLALEFGGFDERIPFAEDNDFCYRWLAAGRALSYDPALVVHHHDWRSDAELERLYVDYAVGQGVFYAKHLLGGDARILRHLARDLIAGARGVAAGLVHGRSRATDWRRGVLPGLPIGLVKGWRIYASPVRRQGRAGRGRTGSP